VKKPSVLRDQFLAWQCRIRQIAMRQNGGRPSPGMRPRVLIGSERNALSALTVLLMPVQPEESTAFFRFQVMRTPDPRDVYERALAFLQGEYFQKPGAFRDSLAAVLPGGSSLAASLIADGACILEFDQFRQSYSLPCAVRELKPGDAAREAAIWHNRIFNPTLPGTVHVLGFQPDWASAGADPPPRGRKSGP
jgi:hypothetical protein